MRLFKPKDDHVFFQYTHEYWFQFELEKDRWEYVDDPGLADVIPIRLCRPMDDILDGLRRNWNDQTLLVLDGLYHSAEDRDTPRYNEIIRKRFMEFESNVLVVHANNKNADHRDMHYDMMWNRQKAFFTDFKYEFIGMAWTRGVTNETMYEIAPLVKRIGARKFLSPTRIYRQDILAPRMIARCALLCTIPHDDSYFSDTFVDKILYPQQQTEGVMNLIKTYHGGTWFPVANRYYEDSYISAYVETITNGTDTGIVTEKTYDPLIKGHYILPFSYQNFLDDVRGIGFWLPDWIDYSYDRMEDFGNRLKTYLHEIIRLSKIPTDEIHNRWLHDRDNLERNRDVFFNRPYDTLHDRIFDWRETRKANNDKENGPSTFR